MKRNICAFFSRKKKDCSQETFFSDSVMSNAPVNYWVIQKPPKKILNFSFICLLD